MPPKKVTNPYLEMLVGPMATVIFRAMITVSVFYGGLVFGKLKELVELPGEFKHYQETQQIERAAVSKVTAELSTKFEAMQAQVSAHDKAIAVISGQIESVLVSLKKISSQLRPSNETESH